MQKKWFVSGLLVLALFMGQTAIQSFQSEAYIKQDPGVVHLSKLPQPKDSLDAVEYIQSSNGTILVKKNIRMIRI